MDETEVQIEIACWAQNHDEASTFNWDDEPWVDFSGPYCTLHLRLGGLTWSIKVPAGYHTVLNPADGKRKRLWEPLEYGDTVIVQSRSTPFHVSVVDRSNNTVELFYGLGQVVNKAGVGSSDEVHLQMIHDMFKTLQLESTPRSMSDEGKALVMGKAYLEALQRAETLAEVLDTIHGLAKVFNDNLTERSEEDEDDEHMFDINYSMRWSTIAAEVNHAREACADAAARCVSQQERGDSDVNSQKVSWENVQSECGILISDSPLGGRTEAEFHLENLTLASPPGHRDGPSASSDTDDEYTLFLPTSWGVSSPPPSYPRQEVSTDICDNSAPRPNDHNASVVSTAEADDEYTLLLSTSWDVSSPPPSYARQEVSTDICDNSAPRPNDHNASVVSTAEDMSPFDSDSDGSDSSWEIPGFVNPKPTSNRKRNVGGDEGVSVLRIQSSPESNAAQQMFSASVTAAQSQFEAMWPWDPVTKRDRAESRDGSDHISPSKRVKLQQSRWDIEELQWCDIAFNPESFSVECTLRLNEFMHNPIIASALGFALEHPLRVEIVPIKAQVDSLAWTGAVDVFVSQHTDWHNHISEDICGLLCLVPDIVQNYFRDTVPSFIQNNSDLGPAGLKGDLFVGLLQTLVRRLVNVNAGGSCCVCQTPSDPPTSFHMIGKSLWPCGDNLCRATFSSWQKVSSLDIQEREREEDTQLRVMEETLGETFSYAERDALKSALDVYGASADGLNYRQMIKALARIELWNQKDPESVPLSYPLFDPTV